MNGLIGLHEILIHREVSLPMGCQRGINASSGTELFSPDDH